MPSDLRSFIVRVRLKLARRPVEILVDGEWLPAGEVAFWPAYGSWGVGIKGTTQFAFLDGVKGIRRARRKPSDS